MQADRRQQEGHVGDIYAFERDIELGFVLDGVAKLRHLVLEHLEDVEEPAPLDESLVPVNMELPHHEVEKELQFRPVLRDLWRDVDLHAQIATSSEVGP